MLPDPASHVELYLLIAAGVVLLMLALRIRLFRVIFNVAITAVLLGALALVVIQRGRFDPYFSRIARALHLDDQEVVGKEVRIRMAPDGHFWATARINGIERRMLIDSGATLTAISSDTARAAGLKVDDEFFPVVLRTANGSIPARTSSVETLRLGDIVARDLPVVVSPSFGDTDVLGMNFLSMLKSWRVEGRTLVLVPHHPQQPAKSD